MRKLSNKFGADQWSGAAAKRMVIFVFKYAESCGTIG